MPPSVQTTYDDNIGVGYAGAIVSTERGNLISRNVEDSGGIGFGLAVVQGSEDKGCTLGDASTVPLGVTVRTQDRDPDSPDAFAFNESARIMTKGVIWVLAQNAVEAGDPVEAKADGRLGDDAGAGTLVPGWRWETSAGAGELAQLRLG